jgi:cysteine desulfurase/selenocysteine lyase
MNVDKIREDFPVLAKGFAYIDSACMSLKPRQVVEAMNRYYYEFPACGERSSHRLGKIVTEECAQARKKIARFIGAKEHEIVFTKNTTEGLNLAANSLGLKSEDIVVTSDKEHNSNFLPWIRFNHKIVPTEKGIIDVDTISSQLYGASVLALLHTSNIDGMSFPIKEAAKVAHDNNALFVVDGAQSAPHKEIDVKKLGCDFFSFSGHKMLGPSIGVLYINESIHNRLKPFLVGGGTVQNVLEGVPKYMHVPEVFEAGLQNYAGAIGLKAAVEYLEKVGLKNIEKHETELNRKATNEIENIPGVSILGGAAEERGGIISMDIKEINSSEASIMFDSHGVLVRGGMHCCHNWFNTHRINGSVRASLYLYNNESDIEKLVEATKKVSMLR